MQPTQTRQVVRVWALNQVVLVVCTVFFMAAK